MTSYSIIKADSVLKAKMREAFPRPKIKLNGILKAAPLSNNYSIVGGAFDYLIRFYLERLNKETLSSKSDFIADHSFRHCLAKFSNNLETHFAIGRNSINSITGRKLIEDICIGYNIAKDGYNNYLESGELTSDLLVGCICLSKLDTLYRVGYIEENYSRPEKKDLMDLKNLYNLINPMFFKSKRHCFLNPTFGEGSRFVLSGDADVLIDDTIIEIKTTKDLKITRMYINQLLGYYVLSIIGGIADKPRLRPIKNIAIYFSRHGLFWKCPIKEFGTRQKFNEFRNWFIYYFADKTYGLKMLPELLADFRRAGSSINPKDILKYKHIN